jgi:hypothetical protein
VHDGLLLLCKQVGVERAAAVRRNVDDVIVKTIMASDSALSARAQQVTAAAV